MHDLIVSDTPQQAQAKPETDLSSAQINAILAQQDFADTVEKFGGERSPALTIFNKRVSRWSNAFTDRRLRRFAYTLGRRMQGETHEGYISQVTLCEWFEKDHGRKIGDRQLRRYIQTMEKAGVMEVTRRIQDERGEHPGMRKTNVYKIHFWKVLRDDRVEAHDFLAPLENVLKDDLKDDLKDVRQNDLPSVSSSALDPVRKTVTPTAQQDQTPAAACRQESSPPSGPPSAEELVSCSHGEDPVDGCLRCSHSVATGIQAMFASDGWNVGWTNLFAVVEKYGAGTLHQHLICDRDEVEHAAWFWKRVGNAGNPVGYFLAKIGEVLEEVAGIRAAGFVKEPDPPRPDLLSPGQYARWGASSWGFTWTGEISETKQSGGNWRNAEDSNDFLTRDDPPIEYCNECRSWFFVKTGYSHPCPGWKRTKPRRR